MCWKSAFPLWRRDSLPPVETCVRARLQRLAEFAQRTRLRSRAEPLKINNWASAQEMICSFSRGLSFSSVAKETFCFSLGCVTDKRHTVPVFPAAFLRSVKPKEASTDLSGTL